VGLLEQKVALVLTQAVWELMMVDAEVGVAVWRQEALWVVEGEAPLEEQAWSWCLSPPFRSSLLPRL
jgi:hypothetical protein